MTYNEGETSYCTCVKKKIPSAVMVTALWWVMTCVVFALWVLLSDINRMTCWGTRVESQAYNCVHFFKWHHAALLDGWVFTFCPLWGLLLCDESAQEILGVCRFVLFNVPFSIFHVQKMLNKMWTDTSLMALVENATYRLNSWMLNGILC